MKHTKTTFWEKLDNNIVLILVGFLAIFIPAYPKLPLFDLMEGYIVRLRLEDIFIAITAVVWFVQVIRKKVKFPKNTFSYFIFAYLIVGLISSINAVFILHTVPNQQKHIFKLLLHFFRRIEYFSLYFFAYSAIKSRKNITTILYSSAITLVGVITYGFGQKYLYWPAFSTMNREFSKGIRLYLTPHSRVMSTFAGHYDYASYLMIALSILIPMAWLQKNRITRYIMYTLSFLAYWGLILTASRTSWLGYMFGLLTSAILVAKIKGWKWSIKRWFVVTLLSIFVMFTLGDLSDRFLQILNDPSTIAKFLPYSTGEVEEKINKLKDISYKLQSIKTKLLSPLNPEPPKNSISSDDLAKIAAKSDAPPKTTKPTTSQTSSKPLPPDVTPEEDAIRQKIATKSGVATISATKKSNSGGGYSENALKYGLSIAIRLDALWPRAIAGFKRNPLLGSGYSTLVKSDVNEFTQAESTDNDYLRMLGETGLLGAISFLALPILVAYYSLTSLKKERNTLLRSLFIGLFSATVALLINAIYIDVFESSKVAYTFWMLSAIAVRLHELNSADREISA